MAFGLLKHFEGGRVYYSQNLKRSGTENSMGTERSGEEEPTH